MVSSTHSPSVFPSGAPAVLAVLAALALQSCACCACCELPSDATADQHGSCTQMSMLRHQALYKTLRNGMDKQTQLGQVLHDTEQSCGQDAGGGSTGFHTFAAAAMVDRRDQCDWLPLLLSLSPRQVARISTLVSMLGLIQMLSDLRHPRRAAVARIEVTTHVRGSGSEATTVSDMSEQAFLFGCCGAAQLPQCPHSLVTLMTILLGFIFPPVFLLISESLPAFIGGYLI